MGNHVGALCGSSVCPKAGQGGDNEIFDDTTTCDPAGAVFPETLEDLSEVDRLLLTFSSSSNLAVIRWLFVIGANIDACDTNGTTCLHAACRSGSLNIVDEFIQRDLPLNATDVAGWTALHVALFMGRRSVALKLMRNGADLAPKNLKGLVPAELCSDVWLREAVASCQAQRRAGPPGAPWRFGKEWDGEDLQVSASLHFEPFFVPRAPALDKPGCESLLEIGVEIFNQRPGQGLAFLVATGAVKDFPVELSSFMMENGVSPAQVGEFLGENFSLSQTLRLEYVNSVRVSGTGVVSCLSKVFKQFQIPSDLHKIDRIVAGIAAIWWRRHEQFEEPPSQGDCDMGVDVDQEVGGRSLMFQISGYDVMHQLMLSTVMLHWNLHAPSPPSKRISLEQWLEMNAGLDPSGSLEAKQDGGSRAKMKHIQTQIYTLISRTLYPELQIWSTQDPGRGGCEAETLPQEGTTEVGVGPYVDGWAMLVGGLIPSLAGSSGTVTYRHVRSILSEATSSTPALATPEHSRRSSCGGPTWERPGGGACVEKTAGGLPPSVTYKHPGLRGPQAAAGAGHAGEGGGVPSTSGPDKVWLSLRSDLLFLASKPVGWAPYAVVDLQDVVLQAVDKATLTLTLGMRSPGLQEATIGQPVGNARVASNGLVGESGLARILEVPQLQLIFLLPDGRWQVLDVPYMQIRMPELQQLERWKAALEEHARLEENGDSCSGGLERELAGEREVTQTI